jgi:hypothetical protein
MLAYSRHLTVSSELNWTVLAKLISRMTHLESIRRVFFITPTMPHFPHFSHRWLHWEERFPSVIKGRLHQLWPDAKLYLEGLSVGLQTHVDEVQIIDLNLLKSLVDFHNIHSIQVVIEYEHPEP